LFQRLTQRRRRVSAPVIFALRWLLELRRQKVVG